MLSRLATAPEPSDSLELRHEVVSLMDTGVYGAELQRKAVPVHTLGLQGFGGLPAALFRLTRLVRRTRPDVLQTWLYHADFVGLLASMLSLLRVPVVWNVRCSDMDLRRYAWSTRALLRVLAQLSSWPAAVVVNSEVGRDWHARAGYRPRRWCVIPNGFDVGAHAPDPATKAATRQRLGVEDSHLLFACAARVDPMKDHAGLLDAFARHIEKHPHSRLVLMGKGTDTAEGPLAGLGSDRRLSGAVFAMGERTADYWDILQGADALVLPSAFGEGFPNVLGEAMCLGIPCITTDVGDAGRVVGDTGWVVPPRSPQALAEAIDALAGLAAERRQGLGCAARRRMIENFSLERIVGDYASLYASPCRRPRHRPGR